MLSSFIAHQLGLRIIETLELEEVEPGKYKTKYGPKSPIGIARSLERDLLENIPSVFEVLNDE